MKIKEKKFLKSLQIITRKSVLLKHSHKTERRADGTEDVPVMGKPCLSRHKLFSDGLQGHGRGVVDLAGPGCAA
jgi:hypothetical protein